MHDAVRQIEIIPGVPIELVLVEGGVFTMGDDTSDYKTEKPAHEVEVASFYLGKYQVTQRQWQGVLGRNPSRFKGDHRPVEGSSWEDIQGFLAKLNEQTGQGFRLPTEAEWEYAARGGLYSQGFLYAGSDKLRQVAWYIDNSEDGTHDVGLLLGNELDIYDMSGNVWEWCADDWHDDYSGAPSDGRAWVDQPVRGTERVLRGGSIFNDPVYCRPTLRSRSSPADRFDSFGFRLTLSLQSVG